MARSVKRFLRGCRRSARLLLFCAAIVMCALIYYVKTRRIRTQLVSKYYANPELRYSQFQENYAKHLSRFPPIKYMDSKHFIDLEPPLSSTQQSGNRSPTTPANTKPKAKLILLWTTFFGAAKWIPDLVCGNLVCNTTVDKNALLKSDALMMHPRDLGIGLPRQRLPNQRWIYYNLEPPYLASRDFSVYDGVFNWTSTYRWDSDFPALYYNTLVRKQPLSDKEFEAQISDLMSKKTKLVAIMNSNCYPESNRFTLVKELQQEIPVDFYGKCGDLKCPQSTQVCLNTMSQYKFYLAFENSNCRDYITEKVRISMEEWKAVPIVFGAPSEDYIKFMPPNSYIHTDGFGSMKELAEYLIFLDDNPTLYRKYHVWRRTHSSKHSSHSCDICAALHDPAYPAKTYRDFGGWYDQDSCKALGWWWRLWQMVAGIV